MKGQVGTAHRNTVYFDDIYLWQGNSKVVDNEGQEIILQGLSLAVSEGEFIGLLGESAAGKSLFVRSLCALAKNANRSLLPPNFTLKGQISAYPKIAMIFQDSYSSLNPTMRVGEHLREVIRFSASATGFDTSKSLLEMVDLPHTKDFQKSFPFELSGGMQQRLAIACALAANSDILIADEALSSLDPRSAGQVINVFKRIRSELGKSVILVSHNLELLRNSVDRVLVLYKGLIIEESPAEQFFESPSHPYSLALLQSDPAIHSRGEVLQEIPKEQRVEGSRSEGSRSEGCPFAPRCSRKQDICEEALPDLKKQTQHNARIRCFYPIGQVSVEGRGKPTTHKGVLERGVREQGLLESGKRFSNSPISANTPASIDKDLVLELVDVGKTFSSAGFAGIGASKKQVLKNISFGLGRGKTLVLLGRSGIGKTTIAKCILRLVEIDAGYIRSDRGGIAGKNLDNHMSNETLYSYIQLVPQSTSNSLNPYQTIRQTLKAIIERNKTNSNIEELLRLSGLEKSLLDRRPKQLSGGQSQRLLIARALAMNPKIIIFDEPLSNLDLSIQARILNTLQALKEERTLSYLFITHDQNIAKYIGDSIIEVESGAINRIL